MRRIIVLPIWLALLIPAQAFAGDLTAEQILAKVSETYRNLKSFHFVTGQDPWTGELAGVSPGRIRLRGPTLLLVSNGETTWTYLPHLNEYTEVAAAPLFEEDWGPSAQLWLSSDIFWSTLRPFRYKWTGLAPQKAHAKLKGEEKLEVGGKEFDCYVVTCTIDTLPHKLWVDKARFIVWRDEWLTPPDRSGAGRITYPVASAVSSWELGAADLGPLPDELFGFSPPKGAERVDSFRSPNGSAQYLEERAAYSLLGVDIALKVKGKTAPAFVAEDLDGKTVRLTDLEGKIVVLIFWASWCRPCQKELSDVQRFDDKLAHKDVVFLGIDDEDSETAKRFVQANRYSFPTLADSKQAVHQLYGVRWVPFVVAIDRKGKVAARYTGARGAAGLRSALEAAGLSQETVSQPR